MMEKPELLAPAGTLEKLKYAVQYGADAVYIAGKKYGLRAFAGNFSPEEMAEGVAFAHERGVKVYVTINVFAHNADFEGLGTSTDGNIYISRVLHKTFISVGEKGTKAGAATIVEMKDGAAAKEVYLDRPFVYMLVDCENNIPFFIGTMMDVN